MGKGDYCDEQFISIYIASLHIYSAHKDRKEEFDKTYKIYTCGMENCGKTYYSTKSKVKHHREFHGILPRKKLDLICQLCGKKYYHRNNLEDHLDEHKVGLGT